MTTHEIYTIGDVSLLLDCVGNVSDPRLILRFELPGADPDSITVTLHDTTMIVRAAATALTRRTRGIVTFEHQVDLPILVRTDAASLLTSWHYGILEASVSVPMQSLMHQEALQPAQ